MGQKPAHVATVDAWAAAWSARDAIAVAALCTDDCVYEDVALAAVNHGPDELVAFATGAFSAFPDFAIHVTSQFGDAEWAGAEWTMNGTHLGDLGDIRATGRSFNVRGATVFQYRDGKISRCTDYWDMAELLRQIGAMP